MIWKRYLFKQIFQVFCFVLLCLFAVYVVIDLSVHGVRFARSDNLEVLLYYLRMFSMHLDLFMPLSFLLASLKVLFDLNARHEFIALQMAGLSLKRLLLPFFIFGATLSLIGYANHEWFAPQSIALAQTFKASHSKKKRVVREHVHTIPLSDHSELVYHSFDAEKNELSDVYWVRSDREFWHMKTLNLDEKMGYFVDQLKAVDGKVVKTESFDKKAFADLTVKTPKAFVPFESRSLSTLFEESKNISTDRINILLHLHHKLAVPLLSLLALFAAAPFALFYARSRPTFLIVSLSLFAFVTVMTLFDSLLILGENKVIPPIVAMWIIPITTLALFSRRFAKL